MNDKKTILVSGCTGEVGAVVAKLFAEKGWNVYGLDAAEGVDAPYLGKYISCDVKDAEAIKKVVDDIEAEAPLTALFHTSGYEITTDFASTPIAEWEELLDTVLGGSTNICQAVAPNMVDRKEGKIVLFAPDYAKEFDGKVMTATAYGTFQGFAKSFGMELAEENVLVNLLAAVTPLDIETIANTVYFLAEYDTYTSAQVVSVAGADA